MLLDKQLEIENNKKKEIQNSLDEKERLRNVTNSNNLEIEKFKEVIKVLRPNKVENTTNPLMYEIYKIKNKINKVSILFFIGCSITVISSLVSNLLLSSVINIIFLITGVSTYAYLKNDLSQSVIKAIPTNKKPDKESLNLMLSFSDDILLKLKKIELNILVLEEGATISAGTVSLIKESVSFCLESYKTKDINLLKDIYIFLDKTLEYIYSLIEGENLAEEYIEKQIYENVSSIIKRNTDVFDLMISDNKEIKEILSKVD